jgi:hypothetical protein
VGRVGVVEGEVRVVLLLVVLVVVLVLLGGLGTV